ncbi:hypothetical protein D3C72_2018200 [compost metagenome]
MMTVFFMLLPISLPKMKLPKIPNTPKTISMALIQEPFIFVTTLKYCVMKLYEENIAENKNTTVNKESHIDLLRKMFTCEPKDIFFSTGASSIRNMTLTRATAHDAKPK